MTSAQRKHPENTPHFPPGKHAGDATAMRLAFLHHLLYVLLFELSVVAGLWQKGAPLLTVGILLAFPPVAFASRLSPRWFPKAGRYAVQLLVALGAVGWAVARSRTVSPDLALNEAMALLGIALSVRGNWEEYNLMALIALILAGYGGLSPHREVYLAAIVLFGVVGMVLLYRTRTLRLLGSGAQALVGVRCRGSWRYRLLHAVLLGVLFAVFAATFPFPYIQSVGMVPVSFFPRQELQFPKLWKDWLTSSTNVRLSEEGRRTADADEESPTVESPDAKRLMEGGEDSFDAREGSGGSGVGDDLVFRVYSSEKLYWLVQLYDRYDGETWTKSRVLKRGSSWLRRPSFRASRFVSQRFSVEKAVSRWLPAAFYVQFMTWSSEGPSAQAAEGRPLPRPGTDIVDREPAVLGKIAREKPPLPWQYTVTSLIVDGPSRMFADVVPETVPKAKAARYYLTLPHERISKRLSVLAERLTADAETPLEKAEALRDHLRENYSYTLTPPAVPREAEVVDHFLFETKAGYCQHFAQALVVLARLAGLPARLATGYSPGNYNLLTGYFEVYEYHAHAWSQVFVAPYGWLTMDGVPPGMLRLEPKPAMIGAKLDPFGEEWSAHPPELSSSSTSKSSAPAGEQAQEGDGEADAAKSAEASKRDRLREVVAAQGIGKVSLPQSGTLVEGITDWLNELGTRLKSALFGWWRGLARSARGALGLLKRSMRFLGWARAGVAVAFLGGLLVLLRKQGALLSYGRVWHLRRRCRKQWKMVQKRMLPPDTVVQLCHRLLRDLLNISRHRRPRNMDLLEYAESLREQEPEIAGDIQVVGAVYARQRFGNGQPTEQEARRVVHSTERIRSRLLESVSPAVSAQ